MLCPALFNDETFYSLVSRISILNNYSPLYIQAKIGKGDLPRAADIDIDPSKFENFTKGRYGEMSLLLERFRCWSTHGQILNLIGFSNSNRNIWKFCQQCVSDDTLNHGIAFWHLKHQERFAFACELHNSILYEINIPFRERQNRFFLPRDAQKMSHRPSCDIEYLSAAKKILEIQKWIVEKKVFEKEILISIFDYQAKVRKIYLDFDRLGWIKDQSIPSLKHSMDKGLMLFDSIDYLPILVYIYFENIESFTCCYRWNEIFHTQKITHFDIKQKSSHRDILNNYLKHNVMTSRTDFWIKYPKTARWLNKYDSNWLSSQLPKSQNENIDRQLRFSY